MDRLPAEILALILRVDEDSTVSYTGSRFKARQAELRKLCSVSRCLRRVARPLLWRVVVLKTEHEASSLIRLILSPTSHDLAQFPETLVAAQSRSERVFTEDSSRDAPGLLMPTTVFRLVAKLPALERVSLVKFGFVPKDDLSFDGIVNGTSFDGKIGIDFSSSGPLRNLRRLVITSAAPYLKRVLAPAAHALVELALPAVFKASVDDVHQVLSSSTLPHLRRLRLGIPHTKNIKSRPVFTAPSAAFLAQLDYLQLVDPVLSSPWWHEDMQPSIPLDHPVFVTSTPILFDLSSSSVLCGHSSPALDLVRHLYVRSVPDWAHLAKVVSYASSLETVWVHRDLYPSGPPGWDAFKNACDLADVDFRLVTEARYAVIRPEFVAYCRAEREEMDLA
ncbi:hypothetical protein JCM8208_002093 [Rhodotorula glutinis]